MSQQKGVDFGAALQLMVVGAIVVAVFVAGWIAVLIMWGLMAWAVTRKQKSVGLTSKDRLAGFGGAAGAIVLFYLDSPWLGYAALSAPFLLLNWDFIREELALAQAKAEIAEEARQLEIEEKVRKLKADSKLAPPDTKASAFDVPPQD